MNVAFFESAMVGLATRITSKNEIDISAIKKAYDQLLGNNEFMELISKSTTDITNVNARLEIAKNIFMGV